MRWVALVCLSKGGLCLDNAVVVRRTGKLHRCAQDMQAECADINLAGIVPGINGAFPIGGSDRAAQPLGRGIGVPVYDENIL